MKAFFEYLELVWLFPCDHRCWHFNDSYWARMKTNIIWGQLSYLAVLTGAAPLRRRLAEVCRGTGCRGTGRGELLGVSWIQQHQAAFCAILCFQCCCCGRMEWSELCAANGKGFIQFVPFFMLGVEFFVTVLVWREQLLCFLHVEGGRNKEN